MKYHSILFVLIFCFGAIYHGLAFDTIIVHKETRLDLLTTKQIQYNKRISMMTSTGLYKGFRIQVLSTQNREDAFATKSVLLANFPDQKAYVIYQSPNFKVRLGNFIKSEEAEIFKKQMATLFKQGIYVVADAIEYSAFEVVQFSPQ